MTDAEYSARTEAINSKFQPVYETAVHEGADIKEETKTCFLEVGADADWEIQKVSFDVPEVFMKDRKLRLHLPQTKVSFKTIAKTKVPVFRWEIQNFGFMRTKIPKWYSEMREIKLAVPEFWWGETSFVMKVPEFYSRRVEWKFHMLKIKHLKKLDLPCEDEKERGEQLQGRVEGAAAEHKVELNAATRDYLEVKLVELASSRESMQKEFSSALDSLDLAIDDVRKTGVDPATVMVDLDGQQVSLLQSRDDLETKKAEVLRQLDQSTEQVKASIADLG
jgi:hypothetical protein